MTLRPTGARAPDRRGRRRRRWRWRRSRPRLPTALTRSSAAAGSPRTRSCPSAGASGAEPPTAIKTAIRAAADDVNGQSRASQGRRRSPTQLGGQPDRLRHGHLRRERHRLLHPERAERLHDVAPRARPRLRLGHAPLVPDADDRRRTAATTRRPSPSTSSGTSRSLTITSTTRMTATTRTPSSRRSRGRNRRPGTNSTPSGRATRPPSSCSTTSPTRVIAVSRRCLDLATVLTTRAARARRRWRHRHVHRDAQGRRPTPRTTGSARTRRPSGRSSCSARPSGSTDWTTLATMAPGSPTGTYTASLGLRATDRVPRGLLDAVQRGLSGDTSGDGHGPGRRRAPRPVPCRVDRWMPGGRTMRDSTAVVTPHPRRCAVASICSWPARLSGVAAAPASAGAIAHRGRRRPRRVAPHGRDRGSASPTDAPSPSAIGDGPPDAELAAEGGDPVTGQLGTYIWAGAGSDSPWLRGSADRPSAPASPWR